MQDKFQGFRLSSHAELAITAIEPILCAMAPVIGLSKPAPEAANAKALTARAKKILILMIFIYLEIQTFKLYGLLFFCQGKNFVVDKKTILK